MIGIQTFKMAPEGPKLRSDAMRCAQAAREIGLNVRTLFCCGRSKIFLYRGEKPVFKAVSWGRVYEELRRLGASIPPERWPVCRGEENFEE